MTYQEEGKLILEEYKKKSEELLNKYKEELKKLGADGKYEREHSKLSKECTDKIKKLKIKYNIK